MKVEELNYDLPKEFIAQEPLDKRDDSKLLILDRATGKIEHSKFTRLPEFLRKGDLLILNNTKVLPARIFAKRKTGGKVEVLILANTIQDKRCEALLGTPRHIKVSEVLFTNDNAGIKIIEKLTQGRWLLEFSDSVFDIMNSCGVPPLPPYIKREADKSDFERYQTIYAQKDGSIAAPTAGLHFTKEILDELQEKGVEIKYITLHVGLGTFRPIEAEDLATHKMLEEGYQISDEVVSSIKKAKQEKRRVVAVGTTTVRALESFALTGKLSDGTSLFIYQPYKFALVDAMVTNFHLPKSTLLAIVMAFAGREKILAAYEEAKANNYRFYSYGDAMLII